MSDLDILPSRYADRWVIITGIRDVDYMVGKGIVISKLTEIVHGGPRGIIFGGARGVDSVALSAAKLARGSFDAPRLLVIVPGRVTEQPRGSQRIISACADEVVELRRGLHHPSAFHLRNQTMLHTARERSVDAPQQPLCVGFTDDPRREAGGTGSTMAYARVLGIEVEHVVTPRQEGGVD